MSICEQMPGEELTDFSSGLFAALETFDFDSLELI